MPVPYKWLAVYYDRIFSLARAPFDAARERVLGRFLSEGAVVCDLACGTGTTALALARLGMRVYGVDLSPGMCRAARAKARQARLPLRVLRADMRDFRLPEPVDVVLCEGDALNHVPRQSDLRRVAGATARALRPGGRFYFDINNRRGFAAYWPLTQFIEKPGVAVVMHGGHDPRHGRAWSDIEWFIREGNRWRRRHERVEEVCWSAGEIRRALGAAGFDRVEAWDAAPFFKGNPVVGPGCRTVWLARKRPV
jgi:SAM-dependent methyltransferase